MSKRHLMILLILISPQIADGGDRWSVLASAEYISRTGESKPIPVNDFTRVDVDVDDAGAIGIGLAYDFSDRWRLEFKSSAGEVRTVRVETRGDSVSIGVSDATVYPLTLVAQYRLSRRGDFDWYAGVGLAQVIYSDESGDRFGAGFQDDTGLTFNGGVDYWVSPRLAVNVDAKYVPFETPVLEDEDTFKFEPIIVSAGIRYRF